MPQELKKTDLYEKRFGAIAIEKGYITSKDLVNALTIQVKEEIETEYHRLIGAILFDLNLMTGKQIEEIVNEVLDDLENYH